jgi:hypothetical protein
MRTLADKIAETTNIERLRHKLSAAVANSLDQNIGEWLRATKRQTADSAMAACGT